MDPEAGMFSREKIEIIIRKKLQVKLRQFFPRITVINSGGKMTCEGPSQDLADGLQWLTRCLESGDMAQSPGRTPVKEEDSGEHQQSADGTSRVVLFDPQSNQIKSFPEKNILVKREKTEDDNQLEGKVNDLLEEVHRLNSEVAANEVTIEEYKNKLTLESERVDDLEKELISSREEIKEQGKRRSFLNHFYRMIN